MYKILLPGLIFFLVLISIGFAQRNPRIDKTPNLESPRVDRNPPPADDIPRERPHGHPDRNPRELQSPERPEPVRYDEPAVMEAEPVVEIDIAYYFDDTPSCILLPATEPENYYYEDISIPIPPKSSKIKAIEAFEDQYYTTALGEFITAIAEYPDDYVLYLYRARTNIKLENYIWAIEDLDYYLKTYPDDKEVNYYRDALYYRGLAKYYNNDLNGAYSDFDFAIELGDLKSKLFLKRYF